MFGWGENMVQTLDARLDTAIQRRNDLIAQKQRFEGKLEAARKSLEEVESECRLKGMDPHQLGQTIEQLEERYQASIEQLEQEVSEAEAALAPYLKES